MPDQPTHPAPVDPLSSATLSSGSLRVIHHAERPIVALAGGATYQPIVGDDTGAGVPLRTGIQVSPVGFGVPVHSHPYPEILTAIEGRGEVLLDGDDTPVPLVPGVSVIVPANQRHTFRNVGDVPLVTFGIHAHGKRIVDYKDEAQGIAHNQGRTPA